MLRRNQSGISLPIVLVIVLLLFVSGLAIFGIVTYQDRNKYRDRSDQLSAAAVVVAKKQQATELQQQFDQQSKLPYKSFKGPAPLGSISFHYPKTWSAYVDQTQKTNPIKGYFYPDIVPGLNSETAFALRVELVSDDYSQVLQQFSSDITNGDVKASAYIPPKMIGVSNVQVGAKLTGKVNGDLQGIMVIMKVRDKTLQIWTESNTFAPDFNNTVLKSLTFNP